MAATTTPPPAASAWWLAPDGQPVVESDAVDAALTRAEYPAS